jgi:hypothetical protein
MEPSLKTFATENRFRSFRFATAVALLAAVTIGTASGADPKPDYELKTNTALAGNCLAEGKAWAAANSREAELSYKDDPQLFRNGGWTFERRYETVSVVDGRYVSLTRSDYMNTGGAHPNSDINTILWDDAQKKTISVRPFFIETQDGGPTMQAMVNLVVAALKKEKAARGINDGGSLDWYKDIKPSLLKVGAVALAPSTEPGKSSGFIFYYPPYAAGPYVEGSFTVFIPWRELKQSLSPDGAAIFGGNLPPDALKKTQ